MTIGELIVKVREEKPNSFPDAKLIDILNEIESDVSDQFGAPFTKYTDDHDQMEKKLLVPAPYDRLYISYLKAKIDYANEEYASYQNNAAQHGQDFADFVDWLVREKQEVKGRTPGAFRHIW